MSLGIVFSSKILRFIVPNSFTNHEFCRLLSIHNNQSISQKLTEQKPVADPGGEHKFYSLSIFTIFGPNKTIYGEHIDSQYLLCPLLKTTLGAKHIGANKHNGIAEIIMHTNDACT